jgi:hypothetical protein
MSIARPCGIDFLNERKRRFPVAIPPHEGHSTKRADRPRTVKASIPLGLGRIGAHHACPAFLSGVIDHQQHR